jgi:hypothetical protein
VKRALMLLLKYRRTVIDLAFACAFVIPTTSAHKYGSISLALAAFAAIILRAAVEWYRIIERGDDR